ncbi:hypothetical protein [Candidatus Uabimicrobium amorphum]|uniref:Uncharacterized protein n=1 Tax=Uabimicrobium amorphum TaxID=2596890 RepID=A0A5S9ITY1_UABAM|nr:hypothetical protein [Candidatus Uabimicrobium amorphum]BBM87520.1 hypothetical protein UABAM_05932 [Candidatus Uabimicrobium amorphum]
MILKITNNKKANALITVLAVLFVISTMAVSFARIAGNERAASVNFTEAFKAQMLSEAGINFAVAKLRRDFEREFFSLPQGFGKQGTEPVGERRWTYTALKPLASTAEAPDDDSGAGIPMEDMQNVAAGNNVFGNNENRVFADLDNPQMMTPHFSYASLDQDSNLPKTILNRLTVSHTEKTLPSGVIPSYSLKIFSLDAQLDLNTQTPDPKNPPVGDPQVVTDLHMVKMLENLSKAIALREPYFSKFVAGAGAPDAAGNGPLFSTERDEFIAEDILILRGQLPSQQYKTKYQILNIPGIDNERVPYLWDFICANPEPEGVVSRPAEANVVEPADGEPELEQYRQDFRSPVNVNVAPWPVLVSVFAGLECVHHENGDTVRISFDEAKALASRICNVRREQLFEDGDSETEIEDALDSYPLTTWEKFKRFLLKNDASDDRGAFDVFDGDNELKIRKALLVYAMGDPNVHLRRTNPDRILYQEINKTDITHPTTELTFQVHGLFEITSLGQLIDIQGNIVQSHKRQTVCRIFSLQTKNTQGDLNEEQLIASLPNIPVGKFSQVNGYSSGNNLNAIDALDDSAMDDIASQEFGHVSPVTFDLNYLDLDGTISTFSKDNNDGGNVLFRCNFNGASPIDIATAADGEIVVSLNADHAAGDHNQKDPTTLADPENAGSDLLAEKNAKTLFPEAINSGDVAEIGDLASDGVIFHENPDNTADGLPLEDETLCYLTEENMPLPPTVEESATSTKREGTVGFWFKLNKNKSWSKYRTVFFATTPYRNDADGLALVPEVDEEGNPILDGDGNPTLVEATVPLDGLKGVQMEIQMKYNKNEADPSLSQMTIQARRKFYDLKPSVKRNDGSNTLENDQPGPNPDDPTGPNIADGIYDTDNLPEFIGTSGRLTFDNVQEHQWYHVVVDWEDSTNIRSIGLFGSNTQVVADSDGLFEVEYPSRLNQGDIDFDVENPVGDLANIAKTAVAANIFVEDVDTGITSLNADLLKDLRPIEKTEVLQRANARMFFGSVLRSVSMDTVDASGRKVTETDIYSSSMTLDDIRIAEGLFSNQTVAVTRIAPTGFENNNNSVIGLFTGRFSQIDENRTRLGRFKFTIRTPATAIDPSGFVEDQDSFNLNDGTVGAEELGEDVNSVSEYITRYNPGKKRRAMRVNGNRGVDGDAIEVLEDMILGDDGGSSFFGSEISTNEFKSLFLNDLKQKWREIITDLNMHQFTTIRILGIPVGRRYDNMNSPFKLTGNDFDHLQDIDDLNLLGRDAGERLEHFLQVHPQFAERFDEAIAEVKAEVLIELGGGEPEPDPEPDPVLDNNTGNAGGQELNIIVEQDGLPLNGAANVALKVDVELDELNEPARAARLIQEAVEDAGIEEAPSAGGQPVGLESSAAQAIPSFSFDDSAALGTEEEIIVTPQGAEFNYNILFEQAPGNDLDGDGNPDEVNLAFEAPVVDDVTLSYQTKLLFFYNIELFD